MTVVITGLRTSLRGVCSLPGPGSLLPEQLGGELTSWVSKASTLSVPGCWAPESALILRFLGKWEGVRVIAPGWGARQWS